MIEYGKHFLTGHDDQTFNFLSKEFKLFKELKEEMNKLFQEMSVNSEIVTNKKLWLNFVKLLVEILIDVPLIGNGNIKSFTFEKGVFVSDVDLLEFTISFTDGRNGHMSVDLELIDL